MGENCGTKKSLAGIYVLIIQVGEDISVDVGALGERVFEKGLYAYVGSAQANLEQRVKRHLRREKKKFWHIDYLLDKPASKIIKVFYKKAGKLEECETASIIAPIASVRRGRSTVSVHSGLPASSRSAKTSPDE